jgi:hypothetical protein
MTSVRPKTSIALVLLMAWVSVWCCCQSVAAPAAVDAPAAIAVGCCDAGNAAAAVPATGCTLPMSGDSGECPFVAARDATYLQAVALPDLRPDFVAVVDVLDSLPATLLVEGPRLLTAAPAHGPPDTLVALHVCLLC